MSRSRWFFFELLDSERRARAPRDQRPEQRCKFFDLCCLFCCPPFPTSIAAKLAFVPPEPTYTISESENPAPIMVHPDAHRLNSHSENRSDIDLVHPDAANRTSTQSDNKTGNSSIMLHPDAEWQFSPGDLKNLTAFRTRTSRGNDIACLYVRCGGTGNSPGRRRTTILYSHGNAVDLGPMASYYFNLGAKLDCDIFSYDYSGYGRSTGKASEKNMYADVEAAWRELRDRYQVCAREVVVYGQSIGTVASVDLAARHEFAGVVLHSPLASGMRVAFPNTTRTWFFDSFPSIEKVPKVTSPVLVIHGTNDEIIDFSHGQAIYERCPRAVEPLWVYGAGHNDIELYGLYVERLRKFINEELASPS